MACTSLAELLRLLELERLEINLFRGESRDIGSPQVFGGQVLGQALRAAYGTVEPDRIAHSLHAYFLRRGDFNAPIVYFVDRSRDGAQLHQPPRDRDPARRADLSHVGLVSDVAARVSSTRSTCPRCRRRNRCRESDPVPKAGAGGAAGEDSPAVYARRGRSNSAWWSHRPAAPEERARRVQHIWIRAVDRLPDDDVLHRCLLAYVSDFYLLGTATLPHAERLASGKRFLASIDHAMWFHWPLRVDEWFLCSYDSPSASGSRGFSRGSIFTRDGRLVASTAQEGLMRVSPARLAPECASPDA